MLYRSEIYHGERLNNSEVQLVKDDSRFRSELQMREYLDTLLRYKATKVINGYGLAMLDIAEKLLAEK